MSEHGAEVTLLRATSERSFDSSVSPTREKRVVTPDTERFIRSNLPTNSLLDNESSPSPRKSPGDRIPSMDLWCTSSNALNCSKFDFQDCAVLMTNKAIEKRINSCLSSPFGLNDWCSNWQVCMYYEMDDSQRNSSLGTRKDLKQAMRNRASNISSRASRIRSLKQNLNPFDVSPGSESIPLAKATSFCVSDNPQCRQTPRPKVKFTSMMDACIRPEHDSPVVLRSQEREQELYYDSDPEENTRRRPRKQNNHTTQISSFLSEAVNGTTRKSSIQEEKINMEDSFQIKDRVQEILNQRYTFIWHPNNANGKPIAVTAWFERGQHLRKKFVQPCLAWKKQSDTRNLSTSKINVPDYHFHSVDLLDISRILKVKRVNRKQYPLAQHKKSFFVQSLESTMLFEARNEKERDRICQDFKLVVARLGSKVIMEDIEMFTEFFMVDASVPGEAPF